MTIDIKDVLTLSDNKEYVVVSKVDYEGKTYVYLIDQNDMTNIKFCYQDGDELVEFDDNNLTIKLLPMFLDAAKDEMDFDIDTSDGNSDI